MSEVIIEVAGLAKSFGDVQAVTGVDFSVRSGDVLELLPLPDAVSVRAVLPH